jgi:hypothetical protein
MKIEELMTITSKELKRSHLNICLGRFNLNGDLISSNIFQLKQWHNDFCL